MNPAVNSLRVLTRFPFVADHQARYGVKRLCQILNIARSSFYYWKATAADRAARDAADAALASRIRVVHASHDGTYGAPRITAELHDHGQQVNRKKVARVMRRYRTEACGCAGGCRPPSAIRPRRRHRI